MEPTCPLCRQRANAEENEADNTKISCSRCGRFSISGTARASIGAGGQSDQLYLLSAATRNASDSGGHLLITTQNAASLASSVRAPKSPTEVIDRIVGILAAKVASFEAAAALRYDDYPVFCLHSTQELAYFIPYLRDLGYVQFVGDPPANTWPLRLTLKGWQHAEAISHQVESWQAFVAMWFDQQMDEAWKKGIEPALRETGYDPLRMDELQHNEKIDDRIIAEIRRSGLLIADFSGKRGGVYFEAGYAAGRGTPVVWCCREADKARLHFDTRQYNHIIWSTPVDLYQKLKYRILATLPTRPETVARQSTRERPHLNSG